MNDNELAVKITADASAVRPGTEATKSEIESIAPLLQQLNASFATLSGQIATAMAQGAAATENLAKELDHLEVETERETRSLREMALGVHEGVESFNKFKAGLVEMAEVYMAAFAVERIKEFSEEMGEAAEHTVQLAQRLGTSVTDIQSMQAMAAATGKSVDQFANAMQRLDRAFASAKGGSKEQAAAIQALGLSTNGSYTQMELLTAAMNKFSSMQDGPAKAALAMTLFGRAGAEIIPILNMTAEQQAEMNHLLDEYGVKNEAAVEKGNELAEAWDANAIAMLGVKNVLMDALAPTLTAMTDGLNAMIKAFIESYQQGGFVAVMFGVIKAAVEIVGAVINALSGIFSELWSVVSEIVVQIAGVVLDLFGARMPQAANAGSAALNIVKDAFIVLKDTVIVVIEIIRGHIEVIVGLFRGLAAVAHDAFTMQWDKIGADWNAAMDRMGNQVEATAKRIATAMGEARDAIVAAVHGETLESPEGPRLNMPKGGGTTGDTVAAKTGEPKSRVSEWEAKLDEQKVAQEEMSESQGTFIQMSKQAEADYWAEILKRTDLTNAERLDVEKKYLGLRLDIRKDEFEAHIATLGKDLDAAKGNEIERLRIANEIANDIKQKYGEQSKEFQAAQDKIVQIEHEAAEQRRQLVSEAAKSAQQMALADISDAETVAKFRVAMGTETNAKLLSEQQQFERQKLAIQQEALSQRLSVTDPTSDPVKYQQILNQMAEAYRAYQSRITQLDRQAILQRTAVERQAINQTGQVWGQNLSKMLTLQQGFAATVRGIYSGMVDVIAGALEKVIEQWLAKQIAAFALKHATQAADGVASVTSNAAVAASAAYAATAAIPIIGPELAPAAAATALAATMSFAPMASAAGGWWQVPQDTIAQIHKEEMVLPASLAAPLRSMIQGGGAANNNAPGAANDSRSDFHFHDHSGTMTPAQLMANRHGLAKALKQAHREGAFAGTPVKF